jgi:hypothetical protein
MFIPHDHLRAGRERYQDLLREAERERLHRAAGLAAGQPPKRRDLRGTITGRLRRWTGASPVAGGAQPEPRATRGRRLRAVE